LTTDSLVYLEAAMIGWHP